MHPFIQYRHRLDSYRAVTTGRMSDDHFVELVGQLDAGVRAVDGRGFTVTPLVEAPELAVATAPGLELWIKDETNNVAASHKGRHLFGTALALLVDEAIDPVGSDRGERLAIASCGNAALAAGVVAAALRRPLDVFVPTWADEAIVARLAELGADVTRCPRRPGEVGDPAYLRFREAVAEGARPFSVQGTDTPSAFDGGRTLGWELDDQLPGGAQPTDRLYLQVGGGAMATAFSLGVPEARLFPVQAEGCAPLYRAWTGLVDNGFDFEAAATEPGRFMWAWESEPNSVATGILDDVTYDWLSLLEQTHRSGGHPVVASEALVIEANHLAGAHTAIAVSATGSAGLAGLLAEVRSAQQPEAAHTRLESPDGGRAIVAFTGGASPSPGSSGAAP